MSNNFSSELSKFTAAGQIARTRPHFGANSLTAVTRSPSQDDLGINLRASHISGRCYDPYVVNDP